MRLSAFRKQQGNSPVGPVTDVTNYERNGFVALLKGEPGPVRVISQGDLKGHSPMCQFIDSKGQLDWAEQADFKVIDTNLLPPSAEALQ